MERESERERRRGKEEGQGKGEGQGKVVKVKRKGGRRKGDEEMITGKGELERKGITVLQPVLR